MLLLRPFTVSAVSLGRVDDAAPALTLLAGFDAITLTQPQHWSNRFRSISVPPMRLITAAFNGLSDTASCKHCSARVQMGYHACGGHVVPTRLAAGGTVGDEIGDAETELTTACVDEGDGNGNDIESMPPQPDAAGRPPVREPETDGKTEASESHPEK